VEELNVWIRSTGNVMTSAELNVEDMKAGTINHHEFSLNITRGRTFGAIVTKQNNESDVSEGHIFVERSVAEVRFRTAANPVQTANINII